MQYRYKLTTVDNPFDPFEEEDAWRLYDVLNNYNSERMTALFASTSDELTAPLTQEHINEAITRIIALDPFNMYKRVRRPMQPHAY